jgi:hypothetical protein
LYRDGKSGADTCLTLLSPAFVSQTHVRIYLAHTQAHAAIQAVLVTFFIPPSPLSLIFFPNPVQAEQRPKSTLQSDLTQAAAPRCWSKTDRRSDSSLSWAGFCICSGLDICRPLLPAVHTHNVRLLTYPDQTRPPSFVPRSSVLQPKTYDIQSLVWERVGSPSRHIALSLHLTQAEPSRRRLPRPLASHCRHRHRHQTVSSAVMFSSLPIGKKPVFTMSCPSISLLNRPHTETKAPARTTSTPRLVDMRLPHRRVHHHACTFPHADSTWRRNIELHSPLIKSSLLCLLVCPRLLIPRLYKAPLRHIHRLTRRTSRHQRRSIFRDINPLLRMTLSLTRPSHFLLYSRRLAVPLRHC